MKSIYNLLGFDTVIDLRDIDGEDLDELVGELHLERTRREKEKENIFRKKFLDLLFECPESMLDDWVFDGEEALTWREMKNLTLYVRD